MTTNLRRVLLLTCCLPAVLAATPVTEVAQWTAAQGLTLDAGRPDPNQVPAFKLAPSGKAELKLRDANGSGKITFYVYDNGQVGSPGKVRGVGPRWGITQPDGRVFLAGILYAPYLEETGSFCLIDSTEKNWFNLTYACARAEPGWRKWEFVFDPDKGVSVAVDGRPLDKAHFDWNNSKVEGFTGLVVYGDSVTAKDKAQTVWLGGIDYVLGGPMKIKPVPPPPPPPVTPDSDPQETLKIPTLNTQRLAAHPRLLLTAADLPRLRAFYASDAAKLWREKMATQLAICIPPEEANYVTSDTDGQRQGLWRLPAVALHYLMTGDKSSFEKSVAYLKGFAAQPRWQTGGGEIDSGMSAANIMIGAALAYDWLYNELEPGFREAFGRKLFYHARAMYHGGHLMKNGAENSHYWQNDPFNNHRWHRDAGLTLALMACYRGVPEENWILNRCYEEMNYIAKWLPEDGSNHEGLDYHKFGGVHITLGMQVADECLGTRHLESPYFKNMGLFRFQMATSSLKCKMDFGEGGTGMIGGYENFFLKAAAYHREADVMNGLKVSSEKYPDTFDFGWMCIVWDDPTLTGGDYRKIPLNGFFPDVGVAVHRTSWEPDSVCAMFKCCPLGGAAITQFRKENNFRYVNVAHDDPDANSFLLFIGDDPVVTADGYSQHKMSCQQNTILVNNIGQIPVGREQDAFDYSQPGSGDMSAMGKIIARSQDNGIFITEGEAAGSYAAGTYTAGPFVEPPQKRPMGTRPALERYRRLFVWVPNKYVLVLDDIRCKEDVDITWLVHGPTVKEVDAAKGWFQLRGAKELCDFQILSDRKLGFKIADSMADSRGKVLGLKQLQATARMQTMRVATVFNPWHKEGLALTFTPSAADAGEVAVTGKGVADRFTWKLAATHEAPSQLQKQ